MQKHWQRKELKLGLFVVVYKAKTQIIKITLELDLFSVIIF